MFPTRDGTNATASINDVALAVRYPQFYIFFSLARVDSFELNCVITYNSLCFHCNRVSVIHRSQLRPSRRQSSTACGDRESPQIDGDRKGSTLRRRCCDHQGTREHRNRNRRRSRQRRHSESGFRSERGDSVGELERVALLPGQ